MKLHNLATIRGTPPPSKLANSGISTQFFIPHLRTPLLQRDRGFDILWRLNRCVVSGASESCAGWARGRPPPLPPTNAGWILSQTRVRVPLSCGSGCRCRSGDQRAPPPLASPMVLPRQPQPNTNVACPRPLQAPNMLINKARPALALALVTMALMATGASAACTEGECAGWEGWAGAPCGDHRESVLVHLAPWLPPCPSHPTSGSQAPPARPRAGSATFQLVAATTKTHPLAVCFPSMTVEISSACGERTVLPFALRWGFVPASLGLRLFSQSSTERPLFAMQPSPSRPPPPRTASSSPGPGPAPTPWQTPR